VAGSGTWQPNNWISGHRRCWLHCRLLLLTCIAVDGTMEVQSSASRLQGGSWTAMSAGLSRCPAQGAAQVHIGAATTQAATSTNGCGCIHPCTIHVYGAELPHWWFAAGNLVLYGPRGCCMLRLECFGQWWWFPLLFLH